MNFRSRSPAISVVGMRSVPVADPTAKAAPRFPGRAGHGRVLPGYCAGGRRARPPRPRTAGRRAPGSAPTSARTPRSSSARSSSASRSSVARRSRALHGIGDPGAGADQDQSVDPVGELERDVQRDPATHRVADQRERARRLRGDVTDHVLEIDRLGVRRRAVAADVRSQRTVAFAERFNDGCPARAGMREAV